MACIDNKRISSSAGVTLLSTAISKLPKGLVHLNLSQTGMTSRGVNKLSEALCANQHVRDTLTHFDLSNNSLKGEEVTVSDSCDIILACHMIHHDFRLYFVYFIKVLSAVEAHTHTHTHTQNPEKPKLRGLECT